MVDLPLFSDNLIGDALMQTPALRELHAQGRHPVYVEGPSQAAYQLFLNNPHVDTLHSADTEVDPQDFYRLNAMDAFQWGWKNGKTISQGFGHLCGVHVEDLSYVYDAQPELEAANLLAEELGGNRSLVLCARHSASCASNDPNVRVANKCFENRHWVGLAETLLREGYLPVAVGSETDAADTRYAAWPGIKLYGKPLRLIAALTRVAAATVSVDTGIRHLAAAAGGHLYCVTAAIPLSLIRCVASREGQRIYEEERALPYINRASLLAGLRKVLV